MTPRNDPAPAADVVDDAPADVVDAAPADVVDAAPVTREQVDEWAAAHLLNPDQVVELYARLDDAAA